MSAQKWKKAAMGFSPLFGLALLSVSAHSKDIGVALSVAGVATGKQVRDCGCTSSVFGFGIRQAAWAYDASGARVMACTAQQNPATVGATQWSACGSPGPGVLVMHEARLETCDPNTLVASPRSVGWDTNFGTGTNYSVVTADIQKSIVCENTIQDPCDCGTNNANAVKRTVSVYSFGR